MQGLVHNGSGMVIPYHINLLDGVSDKIHGIPNIPLGYLGAYEWVEFAWMEGLSIGPRARAAQAARAFPLVCGRPGRALPRG